MQFYCSGTFLLFFTLLTDFWLHTSHHHLLVWRAPGIAWQPACAVACGSDFFKTTIGVYEDFFSLLETERKKNAFLKTPRTCRLGPHRPHQWTDDVILPFFTSSSFKLIIQEDLEAEFVPTFKKVSLQISLKHHALPVFVRHFSLNEFFLQTSTRFKCSGWEALVARGVLLLLLLFFKIQSLNIQFKPFAAA